MEGHYQRKKLFEENSNFTSRIEGKKDFGKITGLTFLFLFLMLLQVYVLSLFGSQKLVGLELGILSLEDNFWARQWKNGLI